jgi:hypothetical protein
MFLEAYNLRNFRIQGSNYFIGFISQSTIVLMRNHKNFVIKRIMLGYVLTMWNSGLTLRFRCNTDIISNIVFLSKAFVINTFLPLVLYSQKNHHVLIFEVFSIFLTYVMVLLFDSFQIDCFFPYYMNGYYFLILFQDKQIVTILLCSITEQVDAMCLASWYISNLLVWKPCLVKKSHLKSWFITVTWSWH